MLPPEAREPRFAVFEAKWRSGAKADFQPLEKILYSQYKEQNFGDMPTLSAYLLEKFGEGKYLIEAQDEHGQRMLKIPPWTVIAGDEDMDDRGPSRNRRFRDRGGDDADFDDYEGDEDPRAARANAADLISVAAKVSAAQNQNVRNESQQMVSMMLMTSQQADARRADEERRREDDRKEERRREEARAEERRKEEREEQRRHEEKIEREREDRRREEQRTEDRRREENQRAIEAANRRTEMVIGALTTLAPMISKVFEKKEDTTLPLLLKMTEKKDADPMMVMLMKSVLDKSQSDDAGKMMMQNMGEMMKVSAQVQGDQVRSVMSLSSDMNSALSKKMLEMMMASPQGQTEEGKSMIEQVMAAIAGASDIVKALVPGKPAEAPPVFQPQQQQVIQQPPQTTRHRLAAPAPTAPAAPTPAAPDTRSQAQKEWDAMTPEQRAAATAQVPSGVEGTLVALRAIQQKAYGNQAELQGLVQFAITSMPADLQDAVLAGDEMKVFALAGPVIEAKAELKAWATSDGVLGWIRSYVSQLAPSIEAVRKMQAEAAAAAPAPAPVVENSASEAANPAPVVSPASPVAPPAPAGEAVAPPAPAGEAVVAPAIEAEMAVAPSTEELVVAPPTAASGSHLDVDDV